MSELSKISINTDGISDEQKATEKFQSAYREMLTKLTEPDFIPVLCAHEAAHAIYFTLAGVREYRPVPTTIKYNPAIDDYVGHLAAIELVDLPGFERGNPIPQSTACRTPGRKGLRRRAATPGPVGRFA